ncbi:polysaccharide biosynthesis tyrosine autokinase [Alteromonas sp. IB21]|uniref:GumC family protein n=1 Tax=Alteromonas sp. IB21 TaxID=2779369 RepID=UPI0018E7F5D2|nr:polysaccharide biosynthesis tyrosine autokinase [Alteromonas sp. IB21]MBJ2129445.1 polysaccharide biosynthesis tyrosine autokinase [Alteromonas sp. IB21]
MLSEGNDLRAAQQDADDDVIDLTHYFRVINASKWRIVSLAGIVTLLVALVVLSMTPIYQATSSLLIESEETNIVSIEQVYGLDASKKEYFETQYEILKSRHIAEKVVDKLNLGENPIFTQYLEEESSFIDDAKAFLKSVLTFLPQKEVEPLSAEEAAQQRKEQLISLFSENLSISPVANTQVVKISYMSESPKLAAQIANTVADVYIENYLEAKFDMTSKATTWLNDSLAGLRNKLEASERKLADFYEREQVVDLDGVVGLASEELQGLSEQLLVAENRLKQTQIIFEQVQDFNGDPAELADMPAVQNHPSVQNVKEAELLAESNVSELSKIYGPKHQKMISAQAELASIKQTLINQVRSLISGINSEYRQAESQVNSLRVSVARAKEEYRKLTTLESKRKILQREVDTNQQLYDSFFTRLQETSEVEGFETANARVLDKATIPLIPAKPKKSLILAATLILSLGFGVFIALVLDFLNSGIRSVDDVERKLGQRMMGLIPWQPHKKKEDLPLREFFDKSNHTFSEAIRTLRTSIQLLDLSGNKKVTMVTSSVPKEGKTTVSINLAFAMGQLGKTLLIDADLRKPSVAKRFDLPGFQPGLTNLVAGTHTLDECLCNDTASSIDVITAGSSSPNPQELLLSSGFNAVIEKLKAKYDHIIIDTAPTQAVSDAIIVSESCDTLLYVVKADATNEKLVSSGLERFMRIGKRIDGVILNQVDVKKAGSTYAYTGYYDQYGYGAQPES